jgi:FkbM family methyltransferase
LLKQAVNAPAVGVTACRASQNAEFAGRTTLHSPVPKMKKSNRRPTAFVVVSTNHGSMLVNRHDYKLYDGGGYGVGYQILNSSSFDQEEVDFILQLLHARRQHFGEGVIAIDCGANIGVHTIEMAQFMHGWGNVLAIEAQERIFYALAGNIAMNNCFNARAIWAAVGAENGLISVPVPNYFVPSSFGSLEIRPSNHTEFIGQDIDYSGAGAMPTRLMTIDDLQLKRLDLIKIDIEGMEMEALRGAEKSIAALKPQLVIEKIKTNEAELQSFLAGHGYRTFPLGINLLAMHESDPTVQQMTQG